MNLLEQLRLMQVKRYPICHTNRDQSVAEHSYNVALIAGELADAVTTEDRDFHSHVVHYALHHDMEEVYTGDMPSSFKRHLVEHVPAAKPLVQSPWHVDPKVKSVVKLADYIEAIYYIREFGGSRTADSVQADISLNFHKEIEVSHAPTQAIQRAKEIWQSL